MATFRDATTLASALVMAREDGITITFAGEGTMYRPGTTEGVHRANVVVYVAMSSDDTAKFLRAGCRDSFPIE